MLKHRFLALRGAAFLRICYALRRGCTCGAIGAAAPNPARGSAPLARTKFVQPAPKGEPLWNPNLSLLCALYAPCSPDLAAYVTHSTILTKNQKSLERGLGDNLASARFPPAGVQGAEPQRGCNARTAFALAEPPANAAR